MIKEIFVLKKNAWHSKLMKFIWGYSHYDFSHICPYFWLSVLNVVIFIPICIIKGLKGVFNFVFAGLGNTIENIADNVADKKRDNKYNWKQVTIENIRNGINLEYYAKLNLDRSCNRKYARLINDLYHDDSFAEILAKIQKLREEYELAEEQRQLKYQNELKAITIKNKAKITKIVNIVKPISLYILYLLAGFTLAFVGFGLYELGILLYNIGVWFANLPFSTICWSDVFVVISSVFGVIFLIIGLIYLVSKYEDCCECQDRVKKFFSYFKYLIYLGYPIYLIYKFFELLVIMLKDNCPAIDWKD